MASTKKTKTRATKKKQTTTKKPATTRKPRKKKEPEFPTHLTETDLRLLEVQAAELETAKMSMAVEEQNLKNLLLEHKNLEFRIQSQEQIRLKKSKDYELKRSRFRDFKAQLWPKYGYNESDGLGYNPETGEIVK